MATLKDLCNQLPEQLTRKAVMCELMRRKAAAYQARLDGLCQEKDVFENCQTRRPNKGKAKNRYSREEAGTNGRVTMGVRTGKYSVCVCSSINKW